MSKKGSVGIEYQIKIESEWDNIAEVARTTKELIENTQESEGLFSFDDNELENIILKLKRA